MSLGGGDRAGDIVRQTRTLIRRFCTKFANKPRWSCGPEPQFMEGLFNHMTSMIEIIMSDSAANEILAGLGFGYNYFVYIISFSLSDEVKEVKQRSTCR